MSFRLRGKSSDTRLSRGLSPRLFQPSSAERPSRGLSNIANLCNPGYCQYGRADFGKLGIDSAGCRVNDFNPFLRARPWCLGRYFWCILHDLDPEISFDSIRTNDLEVLGRFRFAQYSLMACIS